jgi:hypothetical protein
MKMKFKLNFNSKTILPVLLQAKPYIIGVFLISVFGYTAFVVNAALNVQSTTATTPAPRVTFDKATITAIKNLDVVSGQVPTVTIGKDNPFVR